MLEQNQIGQKPRRNRRASLAIQSAADASGIPSSAAQRGLPWAFASAEDYDGTGILAGVDLSASLYWWMPDLYTSPAPDAADAGSLAPAPVAAGPAAPVAVTTADTMERSPRGGQAARRPGSPSTAAA